MKKNKLLIPFTVYAVLYAALITLFLPGIRTSVEIHPGVYWLYLFGNAFLISYLLMPFAIMLGFRSGIVDHPDTERKQHAHPTPLTGGVAIYIATFITILVNFHFSWEMKGVMIGSTIIFIVGIIDDRWGLSAKVRIFCQIIASFVLVYFGVRVTFVPDLLGGIFTESIITMIWLIGITNSMNFIDGMDGLAAGTSIIYSTFFAVIALMTGQLYMMYLSVAVAGGCLGFFPYNFRRKKPAKVFLGDSGATFLGFILASFALMGTWGDSIVDLVIPVLIMSVLIFDMTLTTFVRIHSREVRSVGQWLHYTGCDHFHHRLTGLGIGPRTAAWLFFSVSVSFGLEAVALLFSNVAVSLLIITHSIIAFIIIGVILVQKNGNARADARTAAGGMATD